MRSRSEWDASSTGLTTVAPDPVWNTDLSGFSMDLFPTFRYNNLSGPLQGRRDILEAWQVLFQFYRDLEEEVSWLSSRLVSVVTKDLGSSLSSTQQLLHRHQVMPHLVENGCRQRLPVYMPGSFRLPRRRSEAGARWSRRFRRRGIVW